MKREDVFNDIFTNPVSGEEYNIFSDNGFGKRLDWEVGKSEDGKETVRPINVSFREIDLSKLDSADLPEGVSPSDIKGFTVAQITAGKIDFENTGHNGYEWDKSDFYVLNPSLECVAVIKDNTFGMEEGMSIKDVIPFSKNSENKINDMINDNKNAIADVLDRGGLDAGSKNVNKIIFDVSGTLEVKLGDVIRAEKGESNADIADKYVNDILDLKLDCIEAVHQADMVIAAYSKEKTDNNGETGDDSFKAASEAVLLKQGALSELPQLNNLIIDLGINNELKDELGKNIFTEIDKKYAEIKEDVKGLSILSKSEDFKDKLSTLIESSNEKAGEKIQVEHREGKIDVLRNETGIRYINPEGNTIEISRDTKNIANHYMEILKASFCTEEKKEDLFASSALMIGESDGTMQGDINNLYEVKEYILEHYNDAFNEFDSFIGTSEDGEAIEKSQVHNDELEISQIIRDGVADRLEEDKVDKDIDKMEVVPLTDSKSNVDKSDNNTDKYNRENAVTNDTLESYKEHFDETTEKLDATVLKYGSVSRRFVSTKAMELSRLIDAKRLGYSMNETGMTQKMYGGYTKEERVLMDRKVYAADIVFTAMDMLHTNLLDEVAYRVIGNIMIAVEDFICKDRDSKPEDDSVDKNTKDGKENENKDVENNSDDISDDIKPEYFDFIPDDTEVYDIDPTEQDDADNKQTDLNEEEDKIDIKEDDKTASENADNPDSDPKDEPDKEEKDDTEKPDKDSDTKDEKDRTDNESNKTEKQDKEDTKDKEDKEDKSNDTEKDEEKSDKGNPKDTEIANSDKADNDDKSSEQDNIQKSEELTENIETKSDDTADSPGREKDSTDLDTEASEKEVVDEDFVEESSADKQDADDVEKDGEKEEKDDVVDAAADEENEQIDKEQEEDKVSEKDSPDTDKDQTDNEHDNQERDDEVQKDAVSDEKDKENELSESTSDLNDSDINNTDDDDNESDENATADDIQDSVDQAVKKMAADEKTEDVLKRNDDTTDNAITEVENGLGNIEDYGEEIDTLKDVISSESADHEDIARALEDVPIELQSDAVKAAFDDAVASGDGAETLLDSLSIITDELSTRATNGLDPFELNDFKEQLDDSLISRGDADAVNSWEYDIDPAQKDTVNINDFGINDITYDSDALMYYTDPMQFEENFMNDITNDINDIIDNTIRDAAANDNSNDVSNDSDLVEQKPDDVEVKPDDAMIDDFEQRQNDFDTGGQRNDMTPGSIDMDELAEALV